MQDESTTAHGCKGWSARSFDLLILFPSLAGAFRISHPFLPAVYHLHLLVNSISGLRHSFLFAVFQICIPSA